MLTKPDSAKYDYYGRCKANVMNVYFDITPTKKGKDAEIASIGMVTDSNLTFYAELEPDGNDEGETPPFMDKLCVKTKEELADKLYKWLKLTVDDGYEIRLIGDACHHDMVLLMDLFGDEDNLPSFIPPVCYDINQDIAKWLSKTDKEAYEFDRDELIYIVNPKCKVQIKDLPCEHNALYNAHITKYIRDQLRKAV